MDITPTLEKHLRFEYTSFDRVIFRGYIQNLFATGSVIKLLRNLGLSNYTDGVMRILTDKLNSHIQKQAKNLGINIHWWGKKEKKQYNSKIDFIQSGYKKELADKEKKQVIAIIKAVENTKIYNKPVKRRHSWIKMFPLIICQSILHFTLLTKDLGLVLHISYCICSEFIQRDNVLKGICHLMSIQMKDNSFTFWDDPAL